MKKHLLCLLTAVLALSVSAQHPDIKMQWGKLIDGTTSAGDQSTEVCVDNDGNVYWFGTYGTNQDNFDVNFGGEFLYTGDCGDADTSQNNNFTLIKTDADGNKLWVVYSNCGDFANNAGGCAVASDGSVIVVSKVRHGKNRLAENPTIIDATGAEHKLDWTCDRRYYRILVTKITPEGNIEWNRMIHVSTEPGPAASGSYADFWADTFNLTGSCAIDDKDNIYLPINYRNPMTVEKADGSSVTLTPVNNKKWNGDSQSACGDFLVLGLDSEGYYRNSLELEGTASVGYCQKVVWADGYLYAQGYLTGDGSTLKAGDFTLNPSNIMSPLLLCADSDLNVKWAKCYQGAAVAGKTGFQNVGISVADGYLWMCGQYNLKFTDPDNADNFLTATQGSIREGFILKLDAATGSWVASRDSRDDDWNVPSALAKTGLTGYFKVLPDNSGKKIFVFGYVMNAAIGVFLREYDAETLEANLTDGQNNVITQGGIPSCQAIALDSKNCCAYLTARGNNTFKSIDGTVSDKPEKWGVYATKFSLPSGYQTTGISDIVSDADDANAPVEYYNLQGIRVTNPESGLYIRRQGSKVSKVIL